MVDTFNAGVFSANTPLRNNLVPKRQIVDFDDYEEPEVTHEIDAPRIIKLGYELDWETGEPLLDENGDEQFFYLPFDHESHETSIVLIGSSGSGKTVACTRILDELRRDYGRSVLIVDSKNQYINMRNPNPDKNHLRILEEAGENPEGVENVTVYLPKHVIKKQGTKFCKYKYKYDKTWTIKTGEVDATGLLLLGNKDTTGKDYINTLAGIVDDLKEDERENGIPFTIEVLKDAFKAEIKRVQAKKRSVDVLTVMVDNLQKAGIISDDGNSVMELFHKPKARFNSRTRTWKTTGKGDVTIFNTAASGAQDIQTKGLITNMISSVSDKLKLEIDMENRIPLYRPIINVEEASQYYGIYSDNDMLQAMNQMQNVMGRTAGILRTFIYQNEKQIASGLLDNDNVQIIIKLYQSIKLPPSPMYPHGKDVHKKGLAKIQIRNVTFMQDAEFLVQILPPKCEIGS